MGQITKITNGESGAIVANRLWAVNQFDYVVETQSDMDSLGSYSGAAYKRVLIKNGDWTSAVALTYSNIGWEQVVFEVDAEITFTAILSNTTLLEGSSTNTIFYNPTVTVNIGGDSSTVIIGNALGVHNGNVTFFMADSSDGSVGVTLYENCDNSINCNAIIDRSLDISVLDSAVYTCFSNCTKLMYPSASMINSTGISDTTGFNQCSSVIAPSASGLNDSYTSSTGVFANTTLA